MSKEIVVDYTGEGPYIQWETQGNRIIFADTIMINLANYERDWPVELDICADAYGNLSIGTLGSKKYVAQIRIPERQYTEIALAIPQAEGLDEAENGPSVTREAVAFDLSRCTLSLWTLI